ncbi:MAG TPA: nuclear transport factor 2 family protein [Candidatus Acidoferrum sp.]|nr:nuclear transport factor 2 family protein [Candidatus Acidoferrum sp.]
MKVALLLLLISGMSVPMLGQKEPEESTARSILALEREWAEGQSRNDNRALNLIFDNALVYVEYGQLVSKRDYLARIKHESPQIATEAMTVRAFGTTAIVVGTYRESLFKGGHRDLKRWRFVDTWVYKKNGWVLVAAAAAPLAP